MLKQKLSNFSVNHRETKAVSIINYGIGSEHESRERENLDGILHEICTDVF